MREAITQYFDEIKLSPGWWGGQSARALTPTADHQGGEVDTEDFGLEIEVKLHNLKKDFLTNCSGQGILPRPRLVHQWTNTTAFSLKLSEKGEQEEFTKDTSAHLSSKVGYSLISAMKTPFKMCSPF